MPIHSDRVYTPPAIIAETRAPGGLVYDDLRSGRLRAVRRGSRYLVSGAAVLEWIASLGRDGDAEADAAEEVS